MIQVINIPAHYERILGFLYPKYSIEEKIGRYTKFIVRHDITSPSEMRRVTENYDDGIVISTKLYNEYWDEEILCTKALEFSRVNYKSRKRTLSEIPREDPVIFLDSLISFMYFGDTQLIEEELIMELFQNYGSQTFTTVFMNFCNQYSTPKVVASMMTFLTKITDDATAVFYMKKNQTLGRKIRLNLPDALDYLKQSEDYDDLTYLYFLQLLTR